MSKIHVEGLSIKFRIYRDRSPSIKDFFVNFFNRKSHNSFSDFWAIKNITLDINSGRYWHGFAFGVIWPS